MCVRAWWHTDGQIHIDGCGGKEEGEKEGRRRVCVVVKVANNNITHSSIIVVCVCSSVTTQYRPLLYY